MNFKCCASHQQCGHTLLEWAIGLLIMAMILSGAVRLCADVQRMVSDSYRLAVVDRRAEMAMINVLNVLNLNKNLDPLKSHITIIPSQFKPAYIQAHLVPLSVMFLFDYPASFLSDRDCGKMLMYVARPSGSSSDANLYCQCQVGRAFMLQSHVLQLQVLYGKQVGDAYELLTDIKQKMPLYPGDFLSIHFLFSGRQFAFKQAKAFYYFYRVWGKSRYRVQDWPLFWINQ